MSRVRRRLALSTLALAALVAAGGCSHPTRTSDANGSSSQVTYPDTVHYVRIRGEVRAPGARTNVDIFPGVYFAPSRAELKVPGIDLLDPVPDATVSVQLLDAEDRAISTCIGASDQYSRDPQTVTTSAHGVFSYEGKPRDDWAQDIAGGLQLTCTAPGRASVHSTVRSREAQLDPPVGTPAGPDGPWFLIVLDDAAKTREKK